MTTSARPLPKLDNSFARDLAGLCTPWQAAAAPEPRVLALNDELARELGLDPATLRTADGVAAMLGAELPEGATPVAQAYAGHQFGNYSPRLGDGRALLLGEVSDARGRKRDIHLKGSGRTPYSRGGDGKAAVGPMLRELVVGEAMHALDIPTTRALAVIATGEQIRRETPLPGAVLVRVASSHLRVGSFQYASAQDDPTLLRRLADHAIARHHPAAADAPNRYLALFDSVLGAQVELIARWMLVGFIHGVMNTDNMTISGETIDYGPCAFLDAFDPATVFSSIDQHARYAFGNQPDVAQWNLARFAEALLPILSDNIDHAVSLATGVLQTFPDRYEAAWHRGMCVKLGLTVDDPAAPAVIADLLRLMQAQAIDFTGAFRSLGAYLRGDTAKARDRFVDRAPFDSWAERWVARVGADGRDLRAVADGVDRANPAYIPRNHLVEAALEAATDSDLAPLRALLDVLRAPFDQQPGLERYAEPAPESFGRYRTFCGT